MEFAPNLNSTWKLKLINDVFNARPGTFNRGLQIIYIGLTILIWYLSDLDLNYLFENKTDMKEVQLNKKETLKQEISDLKHLEIKKKIVSLNEEVCFELITQKIKEHNLKLIRINKNNLAVTGSFHDLNSFIFKLHQEFAMNSRSIQFNKSDEASNDMSCQLELYEH